MLYYCQSGNLTREKSPRLESNTRMTMTDFSDNKFKNNSGKWRTFSLFFEYPTKDVEPVYTLAKYDKEKDGKTFPSLYQLYMQCLDPTEFLFAEEHLGGPDHLRALRKAPTFRKELDSWKADLELKLQALALRNIVKASVDEANKNTFQANKLLLDKGWQEKRTKTDKDKVKEAADEFTVESLAEIKKDLDRLEIN